MNEAEEPVEIEELGIRAPGWCLYARDTGEHAFGSNGKCHGCGKKEGK